MPAFFSRARRHVSFPLLMRNVARRVFLPWLAVALVITGTVVVVQAHPAAAATAVQLTTDESAQLSLINEHRRRNGLPALVVDARAQSDARDWARRLGQAGTIAHDPGLEADCDAASSTCSGWAENVGVAASAAEVFDRFVASPPHEHNLRLSSAAGQDPYRVGIGVYRAGGSVYVVHRFIRCDCHNDALAGWMNEARQGSLAFASALYHDFLDRSATTAGLDTVAAPILYGLSRRDAVWSLAYSDAWIGALVDRYYVSTLGRHADDAGKRFWIGAIGAGESPAEVAAEFFASDEHYARVGGTDRDWIADLYQQLLGRRVERSGLDYWLDALHRSSRRDVAVVLYQSVESRQRRVRGLYELLLGRQPDGAGLDFWTGQLADGQDVRLAVELASCDEYVQRARQRFG